MFFGKFSPHIELAFYYAATVAQVAHEHLSPAEISGLGSVSR
jgi:hypothetical protein